VDLLEDLPVDLPADLTTDLRIDLPIDLPSDVPADLCDDLFGVHRFDCIGLVSRHDGPWTCQETCPRTCQ